MKDNQLHNTELQEKAVETFDLKKIKELLDKLKNNKSLSKKDFENIDKQDNNLSETEKKLYEKLWDTKSIISFLEWVINILEKKDSILSTSWKSIWLKQWWETSLWIQAASQKWLWNISKYEISAFKISKKILDWKPLILWNIVNNKELNTKLNKIWEKFKNKEELLKNREARLQILNIDASMLKLCPQIRFKAWTFTYLYELKKEIVEIENKELAKQLKWYLPKDKISNILNWDCKSENLEKILLEKWMNEEQIKNILYHNSLTWLNKDRLDLRDIIKDKDITIYQLENLKQDKLKNFLDKNFSQEDKKKILTILQKINYNKKQIEINNILKSWTEWYNYFSNEYYLNNQKKIKFITKPNKFIEVIKFLKTKWNISKWFYDISNPKLRKNFQLISKFYEISDYNIIFSDLKEVDFSTLKDEEKEKFLNMIINKDFFYTYIELNKNFIDINKIKDTKLKNKINEYLNFKYTQVENPIFWAENNIIQILNNDKYLLNKLKKNPIKILEEYLNNYDINIINKYPKSFKYILSNKNLVDEIVVKDKSLKFYKNILNSKQKAEHSISYTKLVLSWKNDSIKEKDVDLAFLEFKDIPNLIQIYDLIKKPPKWDKLIQDLLKRPLFRLTLSNFQIEHREDIISLKWKNKIKLNEIFQEHLKTLEEERNKYKMIYNKSELKNTLSNNNNDIINNIYNNKDFINYLSIQQSEIQWPIVWIIRLTLWEWWENENIDEYISIIANSITQEELAKKLKEINSFIKMQIEIETKNIFNNIPEDLRKKLIKISFLNNKWSINWKNIYDFLNEYKKNNPKSTLTDKEIVNLYFKTIFKNPILNKNDIDIINKSLLSNIWKLWNSSLNINWIGWLTEMWLNQYINNKKIDAIEHDKEIYEAYKQKNYEKVNKLEKEYYKKLEQKEKNNKEESNKEKNNKNQKNINYDNYTINKSSDNNYTINIDWEKIDWLTKDEIETLWVKKDKKWEIIIENKEALKNLINMKETLESIWIDFAWKYRNELINIMKSSKGFMWMQMDLNDKNLINHTELNNYLRFILTIIWENPDTTLMWNKQKIRQLNDYSQTNKNKNTMKWWLSKVWEKFIDMWFLTTNWTLQTNWSANLNYHISNRKNNIEKKS